MSLYIVGVNGQMTLIERRIFAVNIKTLAVDDELLDLPLVPKPWNQANWNLIDISGFNDAQVKARCKIVGRKSGLLIYSGAGLTEDYADIITREDAPSLRVIVAPVNVPDYETYYTLSDFTYTIEEEQPGWFPPAI